MTKEQSNITNIIVAKDFWGSEDMTAVNDAIAAGNDYEAE